jgi:outer membrane protein OmpA-like peptidoglycan-associated protein
MKLTLKLLAVTAFVLITGTSFGARAEEQAGFPIQRNIDTRLVHATHTLHNLRCGMGQVSETVADPVLFATASDKLSPEAKAEIKKVAATIKGSYQGRHILVSGYTDGKGKNAANQRLSYHRAVAVVKQLVKDGVPAAQLTAQGFGKENPVATNATPEGRALNRRVTFTVGDKMAANDNKM